MRRILLAAPALVFLACAGGDTAGDTTGATTAATAGATTATPTMASGAMVDPNTASREQLMAAGLDSAAAAAVIAGRPYQNMVAVNRALPASMDSTARRAVYEKVWMPIDLNTASDEEILLIPGVGRRMLHEFKEYRPYDNIAKFRREIGKYVDSAQVAAYEKYVTIRQ